MLEAVPGKTGRYGILGGPLETWSYGGTANLPAIERAGHAARPAFVVAHSLLVRLEAVDGPGHVLVPVTMRTQVRDDASDVPVRQPGLGLSPGVPCARHRT